MTTTDNRTRTNDTTAELPSRTTQVPRSRGALSGILLIVLGAWGALIPFIGPYFNLSYLPDTAWHWTSARGWLEVLPGAAAFVGGVLSLMSSRRGVISLGAWLGVAAGAWFVIGRGVSQWWNIGSPGVPAGTSNAVHAVETLVMFTGLGALILFVAATAVGRLSVTTVRDARVAQRRAVKAERRDRRGHDSAYEAGRKDGLAQAQGNRTTDTDESRRTVEHQGPVAQQGPRAQQVPVEQRPVEQQVDDRTGRTTMPATGATSTNGAPATSAPPPRDDNAPTTGATTGDAPPPPPPPPARERPVDPR